MVTPLPKIRKRKDMESVRTSLPYTPSESDDEVLDINAVLFEEIHVPSQQDPEPLIKSLLRDGAEHVTIGQVGNNLVYANPGGHGILAKLEQMKMQIGELQKETSQIGELQSQISELQKETSSLKSRVRLLAQCSEGYLSIRRRFLDVYKMSRAGREQVDRGR